MPGAHPATRPDAEPDTSARQLWEGQGASGGVPGRPPSCLWNQTGLVGLLPRVGRSEFIPTGHPRPPRPEESLRRACARIHTHRRTLAASAGHPPAPCLGSSSLTLQKGLRASVRPRRPVPAAPLPLLNTKTRARLPRTRSGPWSLPPARLPSSRPSSPAASERQEEGQWRARIRGAVPRHHLPGCVGRPRSI